MNKDILKELYIQAMRDKNETLKVTIAEIRGAVQYAETSKGRETEVDDAEIVTIINKCVKECKESLEGFEKAGYSEQVDFCKAKLQIFESLLPESISNELLEDLVTVIIHENGATSMRDMGTVMKASKEAINKRNLNFDGKMLSEIVKKLLN
jgi:uncharacterized protein YqeY